MVANVQNGVRVLKGLNITGSIAGIALCVLALVIFKPTTTQAFIVFATWTCAPFIVTLVLSFTHENKMGLGVGIYASLLIGIVLFLDVKYWHPDPQGGIAVLMLPLVFFAVIAGSITLIKARRLH